jgi:hypothetical protein
MATTTSKQTVSQANAPAVPDGPAPASGAEPTEASELERLRAENADLRRQLGAAGQAVPPAKPSEPSFTFSEGQRDELERTGRTVSPFTGQRFVGTGIDDARKATAKEFIEAKPPARPTDKKS